MEKKTDSIYVIKYQSYELITHIFAYGLN